MSNDLNLSADIIDTRDIIARIEELESELSDMSEDDRETDKTAPTDSVSDKYHDLHCELLDLRAIMEELKGNGGDEQWRGDWYPVTLISEPYFEEYMDELIEDCYSIPKLPSFISIKIDYVALKMDYTSIEINGNTYWYR